MVGDHGLAVAEDQGQDEISQVARNQTLSMSLCSSNSAGDQLEINQVESSQTHKMSFCWPNSDLSFSSVAKTEGDRAGDHTDGDQTEGDQTEGDQMGRDHTEGDAMEDCSRASQMVAQEDHMVVCWSISYFSRVDAKRDQTLFCCPN